MVDIPSLGEFISTVGLAVALVVFFVWNGQRREDAAQQRIAEMEQFQRTELLTLARQSAAALSDNHRLMTELAAMLTRCMSLLDKIEHANIADRGQPHASGTTPPVDRTA